MVNLAEAGLKFLRFLSTEIIGVLQEKLKILFFASFGDRISHLLDEPDSWLLMLGLQACATTHS